MTVERNELPPLLQMRTRMYELEDKIRTIRVTKVVTRLDATDRPDPKPVTYVDAKIRTTRVPRMVTWCVLFAIKPNLTIEP